MESILREQKTPQSLTFTMMSIPAKALATCIIFTLAVGMFGALGQVAVHDIIPTFYSKHNKSGSAATISGQVVEEDTHSESTAGSERGDLFSELSKVVAQPQDKPFYQDEQFVWTLRWTHIHLFGINMIFILMGGITLFLDASSKLRTWLIVLPFAGVLIDILAMWLKGFVSPIFFWLHIPGGGMFGGVFCYVSLRALWEMWLKPVSKKASSFN